MKIGIDGYEANVTNRVGIGQFAFQIISHLYQLDQKNEYTIYLPTEPLADMPLPRNNWRYVIGKKGKLWTVTQLPKLIKKNSHDVFFSPTHYSPWFIRIPTVVSIMDLSYLHYPYLFKKKDLWQLKYMGGLSIKKARHIITISKFSKNEIKEKYHVSEDHIDVVYPGITVSTSLSKEKTDEILHRYKVDRPFILFVGTMQPRKNFFRLMSAYEHLGKDIDLVIIGKKGWLYKESLERIETTDNPDKVKLLDFVSNEELPAFYARAQCFVLPSLYEGFGIPVIEALSFGLPVVVSNTSSLPEVAGNAGIFVDPDSWQDIAKGIVQALQLSPEEREKYKIIAASQVQKFNWSDAAMKTLHILEKVGAYERPHGK